MDAIQYAYSTAVNSIFNSNADIKYLYILVVNILPSRRIEHITLGPILDSKASINSNYRIIITKPCRKYYGRLINRLGI
jgi:hypothetical protein